VREVALLAGRHPEVDYTYSTIGAGLWGQVNEGEIYVKMVPKGKRSLSQQEFEPVLRRELAGLPGLRTTVLPPGGFAGVQKPVQVHVRGPQIDELRRISDELLAIMRRIPGVIEAESGLEADRPELRVDLRRDLASDLGLGVAAVARTLRPALAGEEAGTWEDPDGEEHPVIVRLPGSARTSVAELARLPLVTGSFDPASGASRIVTLGHIASLTESSGPQKIQRRNLERVVSVESNYEVRTLTEVSRDIERGAKGIDLPAGYTITLGGETEDFRETVGYILESLAIAVVFIYLILASQFGSFLYPLAIMLSLPLSLVGVFIALLLTGSDFNIMSMIGIIMLMGLVTKNAILLVDFANQARAKGGARRDALIDAGEIRLRPIVMTTLAMIFGMLPIALALGAGAEFRAPMARAVIGGLVASTLLTLVVVPVVYTVFDDAGGWMRRRLTRGRPAGGKAKRAHPAGAPASERDEAGAPIAIARAPDAG
jgi:HAE1 family hydrophobic/amphiphilic exporter-1